MLNPRIVSQGKLLVAALALVVGALLCCLLIPPVAAFEPAQLPALLLFVAGAARLATPLLPLRPRWRRWARPTLAVAGALVAHARRHFNHHR